MSFDKLKDAEWESTPVEIGPLAGMEDMLLNYKFTNGYVSADIFDATIYADGDLDGQQICRRLRAALNYCKGMTIEEMENGR